MKAPLLIQFADGTHTVHAFPDLDAHNVYIDAEKAHAQAKGLKAETFAATHQTRKTDVLVTHPANQAARMPTRKEVRAILKQYSEAQR